ncbi:MAG: hypothetical protein Q8P31_13960 [Bacillota bacterium]|nr:hypothetical protein [Bacillota bacterium]
MRAVPRPAGVSTKWTPANGDGRPAPEGAGRRVSVIPITRNMLSDKGTMITNKAVRRPAASATSPAATGTMVPARPSTAPASA